MRCLFRKRLFFIPLIISGHKTCGYWGDISSLRDIFYAWPNRPESKCGVQLYSNLTPRCAIGTVGTWRGPRTPQTDSGLLLNAHSLLPLFFSLVIVYIRTVRKRQDHLWRLSEKKLYRPYVNQPSSVRYSSGQINRFCGNKTGQSDAIM